MLQIMRYLNDVGGPRWLRDNSKTSREQVHTTHLIFISATLTFHLPEPQNTNEYQGVSMSSRAPNLVNYSFSRFAVIVRKDIHPDGRTDGGSLSL